MPAAIRRPSPCSEARTAKSDGCNFLDMTRSRWIVVLVVGLAAAAIAAFASWTLGRQQALTNLAFVDVSASTAARAMQDDHFYSDYGDKVLVVHGTVASVQNTTEGRQVALRTDPAFGLTCTIASPAAGPQPGVGTVLSLVAIGGSAQREPSSVSLLDCRAASGL
jgi:triacylglycerol esterase/lipase EstA (alpha/beta hydrolase family)